MITKQSPLQGMNRGAVATVSIRELPSLHTIDLRVAPGSAVQAAAAQALGMDLSRSTGHISLGALAGEADAHALCLAPDWWLVVGFADGEHKLAKLLLLKNEYHLSAVDVSGQRTTIELEGPNASDVLAHLWDQDLREKSFPVASVSQGLMAKSPVIVCHVAPCRYRIMVRSSFALHLWQALVDASEEWV